jgi:hypothetical protein
MIGLSQRQAERFDLLGQIALGEGNQVDGQMLDNDVAIRLRLMNTPEHRIDDRFGDMHGEAIFGVIVLDMNGGDVFPQHISARKSLTAC